MVSSTCLGVRTWEVSTSGSRFRERICSFQASRWYWGTRWLSSSSTRLAEPMMWWSVRMFLSISERSISIWTIFAWLAKEAGSRATRSEKRQPTAMSRSHWSQAVLEAWVPCIPTMPVVRGCAPGKPPPPMTVMATGQSSFSANSRNCRSARPRTTPPPHMSSGRWDWAIISTSLSISPRSGSGGLRPWRRFSSRMLPQERFSFQGMNS